MYEACYKFNVGAPRKALMDVIPVGIGGSFLVALAA